MNKKILIGIFLCFAVGTVTFAKDKAKTKAKQQKTLKQTYKGVFLIGCADDLTSNNDAYQASIKAQYDIVTPENCMKPQPIHPSEDTYNFKTTDAMVEWCEKNGLKVWGHTLGWHSQTPQWFFQEKSATPAATTTQAAPPVQPAAAPAVAPATPGNPTPGAPAGAPGMNGQRPNRGGFGGGFGAANAGPQASKEVILERLKKHIMTVVGRYKGRIYGWDVFNESIEDEGDHKTENLRAYSWYKSVGPEVLTLAFKWAHEADPKAKLYYNDYNIEQGAVENKGKHASSMMMLKRLIAEGAPITGVGIQGHWHLDTNLADVEKAIENYASLGLKVSITELDVTATGNNSGAFSVNQGSRTIPAENYQKQAEVYKKLFQIFMRHKKDIERVTFWGLSDTRSWRRGQDALLFDGQLNPKPAYNAVLEARKSK